MLPRAEPDRPRLTGYNFSRQETAGQPALEQPAALDCAAERRTRVLGRAAHVQFEPVPARRSPPGRRDWGFFDGAYIFSDSSVNGGWNHVFGTRHRQRAPGGVRRQTEGFQTQDGCRLARTPQERHRLHAAASSIRELNTLDADPARHLRARRRHRQRRRGLQLSITPGRHGAGLAVQRPRQRHLDARARTRSRSAAISNSCRTTKRAAATGSGEFTFNRNTTNPLDTEFAYSNALLGVFQQYTETDPPRQTRNRAWLSEFYAQDTWQADARG